MYARLTVSSCENGTRHVTPARDDLLSTSWKVNIPVEYDDLQIVTSTAMCEELTQSIKLRPIRGHGEVQADASP